MSKLRDFTSLQQLLDGIIEVTEQRDFVSVETIMSCVGQRSFGPLVLLAGLMVLAPIIGDIPGVPTTIALGVLLLSVQLMFNRDYFWLLRPACWSPPPCHSWKSCPSAPTPVAPPSHSSVWPSSAGMA